MHLRKFWKNCRKHKYFSSVPYAMIHGSHLTNLAAILNTHIPWGSYMGSHLIQIVLPDWLLKAANHRIRPIVSLYIILGNWWRWWISCTRKGWRKASHSVTSVTSPISVVCLTSVMKNLSQLWEVYTGKPWFTQLYFLRIAHKLANLAKVLC